MVGAVAWWCVRYVVGARDQGTAGTVLQGLAAVAAVLGGVAVWLMRQAPGKAVPVDLSKAADDLAARLERQWAQAARERGLVDRLLTVHWAWSTRPLSGPVADATGDPEHPRFRVLPGLSRIGPDDLTGGDIAGLFAVYGGLDSGRIVLVGRPGSGKSGAMIRLLLDALGHRAAVREAETRFKIPVPVLLTAYDWIPEREELAAWVARRLADEHPYLKAAAGTVSTARALVDAKLISVLIDGLDEMPEVARVGVLRQIGQQATARVVLSSRGDELAAAVAGGHLNGAAALELAAIPARQAADYLKARTMHPTPPPWQQLIQRLEEDPDGPLAMALGTPLMLSLLLETYLPFDPVDELTDPARFPTRQDVEDHLLARILPTAYAPRPGTLEARYTLEQAQRWLGYLAASMNDNQTRDLAWWRIASWLPIRRYTTICVFIGLVTGLTTGLVAGLVTGLAFRLAFGLVVGLAIGFLSGLWVGLSSWLAGGLANAGPTDHDSIPTQYHRRSFLSKGIREGFLGPILVGLGFGLGCELPPLFGVGATGSASGLVRHLGLAGLAAGPVGGLLYGLVGELGTPQPADRLITPIASWRGNRRQLVVNGLVVGLLYGLTYGLMAWVVLGLAYGLVAGIGFAPAVGLMYGPVSGRSEIDLDVVGNAWDSHIAFMVINRAGQGPPNMMNFLEDARERGILRTAGPVYQFRHARLQDLLADRSD